MTGGVNVGSEDGTESVALKPFYEVPGKMIPVLPIASGPELSSIDGSPFVRPLRSGILLLA
jgi:hypothetical protein